MSEPFTVPDTIPDELLEQPPQDEVIPQGDTIKPTKPSWQDKVFSRAKKEPRAAKPKTPLPPKRRGGLKRPLTEMYTAVGTMLMPFDPQCGGVILANAEKCADALDALAHENDAVRRALLSLVQTSVWGQLVAAHLPILLAIATHHVAPVREAMSRAPTIMMPMPEPSQNGHGPYGQ